MSALYSRSTCLILVCFLVGSLNSKHVRTDSTDTFCHFDVEWLLFFLSNLLFILFFLCLSLIPPCNLMTWIKKINFRAVSDLSCECVPLVRLRRGGKKNGKWWRFVSTDQEHIRWILLDYFRIKHFKYFHKYSLLLVLKLNAWLLFNQGNMEDFCSCNVRGALEMFIFYLQLK